MKKENQNKPGNQVTPNKPKGRRIRKRLPRVNNVINKTRRSTKSIYDPIRFPTIALSVCRNTGADNKVLGDIFGVGPNTIKTWCYNNPEFKHAVQIGRDEYDIGKVEPRLLDKAVGYKYEEETWERQKVGYEINELTEEKEPVYKMVLTKIEKKEKAPDTTSLIFWLKNRNPDRWRDVNRIEKTNLYPNGLPTNQTNHIHILENATTEQLKMLAKLTDQTKNLIEVK